MMFTCVSMVMSLTIFAYILGEISNLVMDQDAELVKTRLQVSSCPTVLTDTEVARNANPRTRQSCANACHAVQSS